MTREEAIKVAGEIYGWLKTDREREAFETLIPELRDGDDERIRKYLIEELKAAKSVGELKFIIPQPTREKCIAYLENLKEEEGYEAIPVESTLEYKLGFKAGKESEKQKECFADSSKTSASEYERIIKLIRSLLENVRNVQSNTSLYKQYDDALAWLEKQEIFSKNGEGCYYYHADGSYTFLGSMGFGPIEDIKLNGERPKTENKGVDLPCDCLCVENQKEQKPAESISQLTVQGKGVYKICPRCKERMIRDDSKVYTSMPPQYGYTCPKCGTMEFDTVMYDNPEMEEQKPVETTTVCGKDYKCKKDYKSEIINCWYIKDVTYHCSRDGYLTDQNGISWSCTPEWFKEYIYSSVDWAEKEKTDFVSGQFIQCRKSFDDFKEGEHYWFEYIGDDTYVGRSDNILNQKFHITPRQLYTLFTQQLDVIEENQKAQKPSFEQIHDSVIWDNGLRTGIELGKQKEQKPVEKPIEPKFKVGDRIKLSAEPKYPFREIVEIKDGSYYFDSAVHLPFKEQDKWEKEEKPVEWSEEDKEMFRIISNRLEKFDEWATEQGYPIDDPTLKQSPIAWFKDLPERFNLQPKPHTVSIKDATKFGNLEYERGVKDGIQSEKSRQWKPTEEQLRAMDAALRFAQCRGVFYEKDIPALESLFYKLKDLYDNKKA